jgi:D-amino-acid dehydrogenase
MPDVVVVGGGIVGVATAAQLAAAGARVELFEAGPTVATGASGRNAGEICHPPDPVLAGLFRESLERYRALEGEPLSAGSDERFHVADEAIGVLEVGFDGDLVRRAAGALSAAQPDLPVDVLDGPALRAADPLLADGLTAFRLDTGFPVRPGDATRAFAALAVRLGAQIRTDAAVRLRWAGGRVIGVDAGGRVLDADVVVVAAGPWTPSVLDPTGAWRPIRPVWGVIVEMALDPAPRHVMGEVRGDGSLLLTAPLEDGAAPAAVLPEPVLGVNPAPIGGDGRPGPTGIGSTLAPVEPDAAVMTPILLAHARRFLPGLRPEQVVGTRSCARPQSLDARPLIGRIPGVDGLVIAAGNGAWGISTGPATARLAADAVLHGNDAGVPAPLLASRFGGPARTDR